MQSNEVNGNIVVPSAARSVGKSYSKNHERLHKLLKNKLACLGLLIITVFIGIALLAPLIAPYSPYEQHLTQQNLGFNQDGHLLGTDNYGRDLLSRVLYGTRISLGVGFSSVAIGASIGTLFGLFAGFYKRADTLIMRVMDILFSFPGILLAMLIIAVTGTGLRNVIIAISIWQIPTFARIVRGSVLSTKHKEYITALRSEGASDLTIIFKHILPNSLSPIIVNGTMRLGSAILSTASLSFIGLGAQPPSPEWGAIISEGQAILYNAPLVTIVPGVAIMLVVFAFNVFGDGLRDALDPNVKAE
ncbi:ABC transporter permease [Levilactobacillus namurensis]|uniref:ABC transporter permease n=1 Tax=Levilactobacillus namurensis TaxID=380393 RepID=UPI0026EAAD17|nr:ABC transporter permease subunit [Levilactobacillus namurensis]